MTIEEAKHKLDFMKKAYQKLIYEKVDSGKLVGDGVSGEWKAETPLDEAYKSMIDALKMAIKALEQEPCEDCISRKQAIELFVCWWSDLLEHQKEDECFDALLKILPPVTPQPKIGKWIEHIHNGMRYIECSKCSSWFLRMYLTRNSYCPNCGNYNGGNVE